MSHLEGITTLETLIPVFIGLSLGVFTVLGIREILKETLVAFKNSSHA